MITKRVFSKIAWEKEVGYCRAIQMGNFIAISGTTSVNKSGIVLAPLDLYSQTKNSLEIIKNALLELGLGPQNIIRTRLFVTDITKWKDAAKAHREFFENNPPATSMIEIKSLINPDLMIEIEADAIVIESSDVKK